MATNLPLQVYPNPDAGSSVLINGNSYTNLVANGPSVPYAYVLNTELTNGIYKIVLLSNSPQTTCGRWAGLVTSTGKGIKTFHIDPTGIDNGTVQFGSRGIKADGNWLYLNTSELQIPNFYSGPVELALELHIGSAGNQLYASVNGNWLQNAVSGINQPVHFVFEVYDTLNLQIVSFQQLTSPSINPSVSYIYHEWNPPAPKVVARAFPAPAPVAAAPPPPPPVPIVTLNVQGVDLTVDTDKVVITGTWVVFKAGKTQLKTPVATATPKKNGWTAKWGTSYVIETSGVSSIAVELWFNNEDNEPESIGLGSIPINNISGPVGIKIIEQEDGEQVATVSTVLTYGNK